MAITLRQLEIFEKVASCAHVTQTSRELFLTQSAVSMSLAELERLAGAPLFERQGKRLLLNDRGREILPEVRRLLITARGIERYLVESVDEPRGSLNLGASTTIGNYLLPSIVGEFSRLHPGARALLQVGNAQQVEQGVEQGLLDLGLSEGIPHIPSLTATPWRRDELVVIAGPGHQWAAEKRASPEMLATAAWIMREKGSGTREIFEAAMETKGLRFAIALELGHTEAIKKAAEAGLGVGCLSRMAVQRELDNGWLVEIATPLNLKRTLLILSRGGQQPTTLLRAFLSLLSLSRDTPP